MMTVEQLINALKEFPPATEVYMIEQRYQGGGDEHFETDVSVFYTGYSLIITPSVDADYVESLTYTTSKVI